ncbi:MULTISPECIES: SDR family oxidoreductase [Haloferax]|uniref:NAD-dependent epimerase/dehydratase family protein n=1 Tax=Haloferax marinum TaxID=2666143 RepID=A0A6A8G9R8_9EURY|nr:MULTISPECIES: SDR family oxidoreductase [Haloferax]KAB1198647.1 SDR family oxidoreductase [Haloferax sp. CBA1150]MRW97761.1 NAD-dependent epimerase/dehydratase family protein [Haloferax marinum]
MSVFLTGFPGFLGSALVERLTDRTDEIVCLVQPRYRDAAERRAFDLLGPHWNETVTLVEGDITDSTLGLSATTRSDLESRVESVFHLAAVYDLAVSPELGQAVNVDGTRHVLEFAEAADVERLHYVSTCYVSGRYDGVFTESDLDVGQSFNNHYEETKFRAEVLVRDRMESGDVPATVYRPAIVVGDSRTGETQKYDGPYYLIRWLLRQPRVALVPRLGDPDAAELNVVPRDYVVDAIDHLSSLDRSENVTYQLCDPNPPTIREFTGALLDATDRVGVPTPTPVGLAQSALERWEALRLAVDIEPETLPYFTHPTRYVGGNARSHLAGTGIEPPAFESYVSELVAFVRENPDVRSDAMA